jgi:eukaryotic-like serine/threonine-protein kinase
MKIALKDNFQNLRVGDEIRLDELFAYKVVEIKEGGMAFVLIVERITDVPFYDDLHRRKLAIKIFKHPTRANVNPELFEHELKVWIQIDSENIAQLLKIVFLHNTISAIMPFYPCDLRKIINNSGRLDEYHSSLLLLHIIKGLYEAHKQLKLVHQDIKPENVLSNSPVFSDQSRFYITDWGISNVQDYYLPKDPNMCTKYEYAESLSTIGTIPYMSPDRLVGGPARIESDIYSLGIMLFEVLFGYYPFDTTEDLLQQIMNFKYFEIAINCFDEIENNKLRNILLKCIHPDFSQRYNAYGKLVNDLYKIIKPKKKWFRS